MSFRARSFIFDGTPSEEFGLVISNIGNDRQNPGAIGSELDILEDRIPRRHTAIHYGTVGNEPLSFPVVFSTDKDNGSFDRYDIARISGWLTGHQQYKKLVLDEADMTGIYYNCIIKELTQVEVNGNTVGFKAVVICDSPFAYRILPDTVVTCSSSLNFVYRNMSNVNDYYRPSMTIVTSAASVTIKNNTDGSTFTLSGMPKTSKTISIDGESMVMTSSDGTNLYAYWNPGAAKHVFRTLRGDNQISVSGACTITIKNEFPWSIGY